MLGVVVMGEGRGAGWRWKRGSVGWRSPYGAVSTRGQTGTCMAGAGRLEDLRDSTPLSIVWLVIRKILHMVLEDIEFCRDN